MEVFRVKRLSLLLASFVLTLFLGSCSIISSIINVDKDSDGIPNSVDVDDDNDGLIELHNAAELNNIRYDLDGSHYNDRTGNPSNKGCPIKRGCKGYELADDISLASIRNWVPIAGDFTSTLEGNGKTIRNLTIDNVTKYTGFFTSLASGSKVQNLSFATGSVATRYTNGTSDERNHVGVLAGINNGTISGVSVTGFSVSASGGYYDLVGGLVGSNGGTIQDSYADGGDSYFTGFFVAGGDGGYDSVGGLVGLNFGTISNSYATGDATGSSSVGGLVGGNYGTIGNSYATGDATGGDGDDNVGGLVGANYKGTIQDSYATGSATGGRYVGGLVGRNSSDATISNSSATGYANGGAGIHDSVGGLVGENKGTISNSYATGSVISFGDGRDFVGGLVGLNDGTIQNSYATGFVLGGESDDYVGGLVGVNSGTIQNSYATGDATGDGAGVRDGDDDVGGLVGFIDSGTIANSYSLGIVDGGAGMDHVGRLLGKKGTGRITITSNYYNSTSPLKNGETVLTLKNAQAKGKPSRQLKALNTRTTGWSAKNWQFTAGFYPTLKAKGKLLCGQLPEEDFVQCPPPTTP